MKKKLIELWKHNDENLNIMLREKPTSLKCFSCVFQNLILLFYEEFFIAGNILV